MSASTTAPSFQLAGRVALITGAARGIGLGIADALSSSGCAIAIQDIDLAAAQEAAERIRKVGTRAIALGGDVTDLSLAPSVVRQTVEQLGGIHILVNNAGIQNRMPWLELDAAEFDRTMQANVLFPILLAQQVVPIFRRQRWGRILNIGSIQKLKGNENMPAYAMSKAALDNVTMAQARTLAKDGITVNLLAPGYFNTLRNHEALGSEEGRQRAGAMIPAGRVGEPHDIAGVALLLCSDAGAYITGQSIYIDGGMSIR